ncbi:MAG TPA: hypothetical protein PK413_15460 [Thermoanaerobaculia bacterium]|nr:hypothetical protein [Thermoanaerobaculia bacterium]
MRRLWNLSRTGLGVARAYWSFELARLGKKLGRYEGWVEKLLEAESVEQAYLVDALLEAAKSLKEAAEKLQERQLSDGNAVYRWVTERARAARKAWKEAGEPDLGERRPWWAGWLGLVDLGPETEVEIPLPPEEKR